MSLKGLPVGPYYGQVHSEEENIRAPETKQWKKAPRGQHQSSVYAGSKLRSQLTNQMAKIFGERKKKHSRKFQKAKFEFPAHLATTYIAFTLYLQLFILY